MPETSPSFFDFAASQARLLSMFIPLAAPVFKTTDITDHIANSQDHVRRSVEANVALWRGILEAGYNCVDAFGSCLTASRDDFLNANNAASPIEFSQRQISALHDRQRQLLGDLRSVNDQLDAVLFQALDSMTFPRPRADTETPLAAAESTKLADITVSPQSAGPISAAGAEASTSADAADRRPLPRGRQKDA